MKSKTWLILLTFTVVLLLACSVSVTSGYFSDWESSTDNVLRVSLLGSAGNFAVLAGSTITNTGSSVINGDLGLYAGTSVTGFPPGVLNGVMHVANTTAANAQLASTAAYNILASQSGAVDLSGQDLGGQTLMSGVYNFSATAQLTGILTLDAQNDANSVFIFQIGSTITTASASNVSLINGAKAANIYWVVGTSATLGADSIFKGNIMAAVSITLNTGATLEGRALAQTGAVALDANTITKPAP